MQAIGDLIEIRGEIRNLLVDKLEYPGDFLLIKVFPFFLNFQNFSVNFIKEFVETSLLVFLYFLRFLFFLRFLKFLKQKFHKLFRFESFVYFFVVVVDISFEMVVFCNMLFVLVLA